MSQAQVQNVELLEPAVDRLGALEDATGQCCDMLLLQMNARVADATQEQTVSAGMLAKAVAREAKAVADLAAANASLVAANAVPPPGNAAAIAAATAWVARATAEMTRATQNLVQMKRRAALAGQCLQEATRAKEIVEQKSRASKYTLAELNERMRMRMRHALDALNPYVDAVSANVSGGWSAGENNPFGTLSLGTLQDDIMPREDGEWSGKPGNSKWKPNRDFVPKKSNPSGKTWGEILDKHGIDGIPFKDGYPKFTKISKGDVGIKDFTDSREDNFEQADCKLAEQKGCPPEDVAKWRKENGYTWHECEDMKSMQKVPSEVHNNVAHSGGISEVKKKGAAA